MELIKFGKKGQITIPREIIKQLGLGENTPLLVEVTPDGAIVLRQAAVIPLEMYTDERIGEFEREGELTPAEFARARALLDKSSA